MDDCLRAKLCQVLKDLTWNFYVCRNGKIFLITPSEEKEITEKEAILRLRIQIVTHESLDLIGNELLTEIEIEESYINKFLDEKSES